MDCTYDDDGADLMFEKMKDMTTGGTGNARGAGTAGQSAQQPP